MPITQPTLPQLLAQLLVQLTSGSVPPTGMLFHKSVQKIAFDYSPRSIILLDKLLTQLAEKSLQDPAFTTQNLLKKAGGSTFFVSLAAYLASVISKKSQQQPRWYGSDDVLNTLAQDPSSTASLVAMFGQSPCLPLVAIVEKLQQPHAAEKSLMAFVQHSLTTLGVTDTQGTAIHTANHTPATQPNTALLNTTAIANTLPTQSSSLTQSNPTTPKQQASQTANQADQSSQSSQSSQSNQSNHSFLNSNTKNTANSHTASKPSLSPELLMQLQKDKAQLASTSGQFDGKIKRLLKVAVGAVLVVMLLAWLA